MDDLAARNRSQLDRGGGDRLNRLIQEQRKQAAKQKKGWVTGYQNGFYQVQTPGNGSVSKRTVTNGAVGIGDAVRNRGGNIDAMPRVRSKTEETRSSTKRYLLKYLYSTQDDAGITIVCAAGWQKSAVIVKELPAGWVIGHASIDNLGKEDFTVNLSYRAPTAQFNRWTIEKLRYNRETQQCESEWTSDNELNAACYGHGFWISIIWEDGLANYTPPNRSDSSSRTWEPDYYKNLPESATSNEYAIIAYSESTVVIGHGTTYTLNRQGNSTWHQVYPKGILINAGTDPLMSVGTTFDGSNSRSTSRSDGFDRFKVRLNKTYKIVPWKSTFSSTASNYVRNEGGMDYYNSGYFGSTTINSTASTITEQVESRPITWQLVEKKTETTTESQTNASVTINTGRRNTPVTTSTITRIQDTTRSGNDFNLVKVGQTGLSAIGEVRRNDIGGIPYRGFFASYNSVRASSSWRDFAIGYNADSSNQNLAKFTPTGAKFWLDVFDESFSYIYQIESESDPEKVNSSLFRKYIAPFISKAKSEDEEPPNPPKDLFKIKVREVQAPTLNDVFGFAIVDNKSEETETYVYRVADSDLNFDAKGNPNQFKVYNASYYPK